MNNSILSTSPIILACFLLIAVQSMSAQPFTSSAFGALSKKSLKRVSIYGAGLAQGSTGENTQPTSIESGVFGASVSSRKYDITALFSLATSQDTVRSYYGGVLINPVGSGKSGAFKSFLIDGRYYIDETRSMALHGYAQYAASAWSYNKDSSGVPLSGSQSALCIGYGAGLTYFIAQPALVDDSVGTANDKDIDFRMSINLGLFSRLLRGDIAEAKNDIHRIRMLGTDAKSFYGAEAGVEVRFNSISASVTVPWVWNKDEIEGLTNNQLIIGLTVQGSLVRFDY